MEILATVFGIGAAIVVGIYPWTFTKSGKKWLEILQLQPTINKTL